MLKVQIIKDKLIELRSNKEFDDFINKISKYDPIIYGGFIRDLLCNEEPKDIDIVLMKSGPFDMTYPHTLNRYEGMRFSINGQDIDLWRIEETRWIKDMNLKPTIDSLFKGTNYFKNKVAYDINENILIMGK